MMRHEPYVYRKRTAPIIESALDTDSYKFTMGQMIHHNHPGVQAEFSFINRTRSVRLADHVDIGELKENLDHVKNNVRFRKEDLEFKAGVPL